MFLEKIRRFPSSLPVVRAIRDDHVNWINPQVRETLPHRGFQAAVTAFLGLVISGLQIHQHAMLLEISQKFRNESGFGCIIPTAAPICSAPALIWLTCK